LLPVIANLHFLQPYFFWHPPTSERFARLSFFLVQGHDEKNGLIPWCVVEHPTNVMQRLEATDAGMLERVALLLAREFFHCAPCVSLFFTCPLAIKLPFPFKENKLAASRRGTISTFSHLHGTGTHPYAHVRE
jgi:hypothetical protein